MGNLGSHEMRLFLDDERLPIGPGDWKVVRTVEDLFKAIAEANASGTPVDLISFDHDLGEGQTEAKHAVQKLIDMELDEPGRHFRSLKTVVFHTANISELQNMAAKMESAVREGVFPKLNVVQRSALFTPYPVAPEFQR
jgi:hypothetical protein